MSPWRSDFYWLLIGPGEVVLASARDGSYTLERFEAQTERAPALQFAAAAEPALSRIERPGRSRVSIALHGSLVRYRLIPWRSELTSPSLRNAFAQHCFLETYGGQAKSWQIHLSEAKYGKPTVGCAVDRDLLSGLCELIVGIGSRIGAVEPYFSLAFNRLSSHLSIKPYWFAFLESGRITLLLSEGDAPSLIRTLDAGPGELMHILEREWAAGGFELPPYKVYTYHGHAAGLANVAGQETLIENIEDIDDPFRPRYRSLSRMPLEKVSA